MALSIKRSSGPFGSLQKESDSLKLKIDELSSITSKLTPQRLTLEDLEDYLKNCIQYKVDSSNLLLKATSLAKQDEPELISNFEERKNDEIKRLQIMQERANKLVQKIEDLKSKKSRTSDSKVSFIQQDKNRNNDEDDDDVSEEFDDDSEISESETYENQTTKKDPEITNNDSADLYVAISYFEASEEGDLTLKANDVVDVLDKREDGWWKVRGDNGLVGMVPSNFLQVYEESEDTITTINQSTLEATVDDDVISEPVVIVKQESLQDSGKKYWDEIKDVIQESKKADVTDALSAMGAIPTGFRTSVLHKYINNFDLKSALSPRLSSSHLGFKDLKWDPVNNQLKEDHNRMLRTCTLMACHNIPLLPPSVDVISNQVRLALFDGEKILSNIWTVRAQTSSSRPKNWKFVAEKDPVLGISKSSSDPLLLIRTTDMKPEVGVIFELSVTYVRKATGEMADMCCGWSFIHLNNENGNLIENKIFKLHINGGTIFERGVDLDLNSKRREPTNRLQALMMAAREPVLYVRFGVPSKKYRKFLDFLPMIIISPLTYGDIISQFRRLLADVLLRHRASHDDGRLIHTPEVKSFLNSAKHFEIMDGLRVIWKINMEALRGSDKKDNNLVRNLFKKSLMQVCPPLLHLNMFNKPIWGQEALLEKRWIKMSELVKSSQSENGSLKFLLSSNNDFEPFDVKQICFDVTNDCR